MAYLLPSLTLRKTSSVSQVHQMALPDSVTMPRHFSIHLLLGNWAYMYTPSLVVLQGSNSVWAASMTMLCVLVVLAVDVRDGSRLPSGRRRLEYSCRLGLQLQLHNVGCMQLHKTTDLCSVERISFSTADIQTSTAPSITTGVPKSKASPCTVGIVRKDCTIA